LLNRTPENAGAALRDLSRVRPGLIHIGPLPIRWYALAYVAGIVLGWWYAGVLIKKASLWSPRRAPLSTIQLDDLVLWVTLGIILGGRLGYALFYKPVMYLHLLTGDSWGERLELFQLWTGGMSFHGGFLGCTLAVVSTPGATSFRR
jgi:phosphatidylglycerol:prolipoprotein diacylglycerol transferase